MGGFDDHVAIVEDWMHPSPGQRTFFSSMTNDDVQFVVSNSENKSDSFFSGPEGQGLCGYVDHKEQNMVNIKYDQASNSNALAETKANHRGCLRERMAARGGFNAPRLNTESIRPAADLSKNPDVRSPCLLISPGLSPTCLLLESPVFLSNSLVQQSPTTGKFLFPPSGVNQNSTLITCDNEIDKGKENTFEDINATSFAFKPTAESSSFHYAVNKVNPSGFAPRSFPSVDTSGILILCQSIEPPKGNNAGLFQQANFPNPQSDVNRGSNFSSQQTYDAVAVAEHSSPPLDEPHEDEADQRSSGDPNVGEDGYNWRKYGQKQVKGSDYPRSYFKCTHPNCPVKKKVERSHEGHITEIIYKGAHNHPKPPPNRRSGAGSSNPLNEMHIDPEQPGAGVNGDLSWSTMEKGYSQDNLETTSSAVMDQQYNNRSANFHTQNSAQRELVDGSSTFSNGEDEEDDRVTHGSASLGYDGEGEESESKRRRIESYAPDMSGASRAIREPRVVVQTTSEVDILDDGYRWRKYGQKVVKGNPNPRSYYKCTSPGCNVRKHVERASHDLKAVITTYEGKHNHDVPAARNSTQFNSGGSNTISTQAAPASASSHIQRPEPSIIRSSMAQFERHPLGSFGLTSRSQLGPSAGFVYGTNQAGLVGLGMAGFGPGYGKLPAFPVPSFLGLQSHPMNNDMAFVVPKEELKLEPVTDSGSNLSNASTYQQFMSRLPLGPQM